MVNYTFSMNDETGCIFIQLNEEKYKHVLAKINIPQWNENNEAEFNLELPDEQAQYHNDDEFIDKIQEAVGDIISKASNQVWAETSQAVLMDLESQMIEAFKPYDYKPDDGSSFIEMFGKKQYVISNDDEDRLVAIHIPTNKTYYFDKPEQLAFLKKEISGTGIIIS